MRRGDERAVTVQIGAVLLLAILFAALAMYQINVVPAENEGVEIDHNQAVHNEFQELRNGIQNAGIVGTPQATAVTLGTQYPTRTVSPNPPSPTGTLETTGNRTLRLENAQATSGNDELIGSHTTTTLAYEPDYNEYRSAPTTRLEHAVAVNDFGDTAVQLPGSAQQLVDGDRNRLTIVLLVGSLSETTAGAVSVDAEPRDGNPGTATIEPDDPDAPIELTVPTESPTFWNDTLEDEPGTTAAAYDDDSGQLTVHLEDDEYDLRMGTVGIGEYDSTAGFGLSDEGHGGAASASPYTTHWHDPSGQSDIDESRCSAESCVVTGDSVELPMGTDGVAADANVDYAVNDSAVGTVSPSAGTTDDGGTNSTTFDVASDASDGDTVDVYTTSGTDSDTIELEISRRLEFTTSDVADDSDENTDRAAFDVTYAVEDNDGRFDAFDRVEIEFENLDTGESWTDDSSDTSGEFTHERGGAYEDEYRITLRAIDTDGGVVDERIEEHVADGDGSPEPDPDSSLEIETVDVTDESDGETDRAAFDVAYSVADTDGNHEEFDRVEIEFENMDADGSWADSQDDSTDTAGEFAYERDGAYGDTYRITLQVYETDGSLADEATEEVVASGDTYEINSVSLASGGGNDIDVTVDVETTDSNAEMVVRSLQSNSNERDRTTVAAADGTYTVGGTNQADEVEVLLRDGDGVERASQTEPWNG